VLEAQSLVRDEQDDPVEIAFSAVRLQVMLVLKDVDVHEERLAGASRAPEGEFPQVLELDRLGLFVVPRSLMSHCVTPLMALNLRHPVVQTSSPAVAVS